MPWRDAAHVKMAGEKEVDSAVIQRFNGYARATHESAVLTSNRRE